MKTGSYKDVLNWFTHMQSWARRPLLRATALLSFLSYGLWRAVVWALLPGYWSGNLFGGGPTLLETAKLHFGPILLVPTWISDPSLLSKKLTSQQEAEIFKMWGYYESAARLTLIIAVLWVAICVLVLVRTKCSTQPDTARNGGTATSELNR